MKRIITLTALVLGLTGGIAAADRGRGGWGNRDNRGDRGRDRVVNRDNRDRGNSNWNRGGLDRRDRTVRVQRTRPAFRDGRFYFGNNGGYRVYHRPVINVRYRDYYRRPALVVENYDAVPGYIWVAGAWNWNGYEWMWTAGHYDVDQSYNDGYYSNDGYTEDGAYFSGSVRF